MTSHGCYLCLLLLSVILIEPSEAGCMNHFTKEGLKNATDKLPDNITVKIMNKPEDIVVCSLMKYEDCNNKKEETCFLRECFKKNDSQTDYEPTCNKTDENTSVPFYHFMCLTDITKRLRDEKKKEPQKLTAEEVCEVYEKVCKRDSPNPAAKATTPTACTTTTPTAAAAEAAAAATTTTTTTTTNKTTPTTTNKTTTNKTTPTTTNKTTPTTTNKTTPTTKTTTTTTTTTTKTTTTTTTTKTTTTTTTTTEATTNKTTPKASTTTTPTTATTKNTTSTPSAPTTPSSPLNLQQKDETLQGKSAETVRILQIIIGVLIFTNFLCPVGVYMYMRRLQRSNEIPNLTEEEAMTVLNTFPTDVEEGSILLTTPESSIIINSLENTII